MRMSKRKKPVIRHVFWDWNGTILDDVEVCVGALNRMMARRRLPAITVKRYQDVFSFPVKAVYPHFGFHMEEENWDAMAREYHDDFLVLSKACGLRRGIRPVLDAVQAAGIPMSIVSACETGYLLGMTDRLGVTPRFHSIRGLADFFAASKLAVARDLLQSLGVPAGEVLLVGDTRHDYDIADALGARCVLLAGGHQSAGRLATCRCPVFGDPRDLLRLFVTDSPDHAISAGLEIKETGHTAVADG